MSGAQPRVYGISRNIQLKYMSKQLYTLVNSMKTNDEHQSESNKRYHHSWTVVIIFLQASAKKRGFSSSLIWHVHDAEDNSEDDGNCDGDGRDNDCSNRQLLCCLTWMKRKKWKKAGSLFSRSWNQCSDTIDAILSFYLLARVYYPLKK